MTSHQFLTLFIATVIDGYEKLSPELKSGALEMVKIIESGLDENHLSLHTLAEIMNVDKDCVRLLMVGLKNGAI